MVNKKGNLIIGFKRDLSYTNPEVYIGTTVNFNSSGTRYVANPESYEYYRNVTTSISKRYNQVIFEQDSTCKTDIDYIGFVDKLNTKWPFIFKTAKAKIMILKASLMKEIYWDGLIGIRKESPTGKFIFVDYKCGGNVGTLMHEISHMYDYQYGLDKGTRLSSFDEFKSLLDKYKNKKTVFETYNNDYSNSSEYFATSFALYYLWYFNNPKQENQAKFPCDIKDFIENKILVPNGISKPSGTSCLNA